MQQFTGTSLRTRLYLLVLGALTPVAALMLFIADEQKSAEIQAVLQHAVVLARAAANEENQQVAVTRNLLMTVADAIRGSEGRIAPLSTYLETLSRRFRAYAGFGIVDDQGRLLAAGGSRAPDDHRQSWFHDALKQDEMVLGPYGGARIGGAPVLTAAAAVRDGRERVLAVAYAVLNLDQVNRSLLQWLPDLPGKAALILLDRSGGILRYESDTGRWSVPGPLAPAVKAQIATGRPGTVSENDEGGVPHIYAIAPMNSALRAPRGAIVLEIPQHAAMAASRRAFARNAALLAVSALLTVLAIWWAGEVYILRRLRTMVAASRRLAAGDLDARIGTAGVRDELSHLAGVFNEMAASLQNRIGEEARVTASLARSREQLRSLAAHQQAVREEERIRIAREIHDQFGQSLTILKMDLRWLEKHASENPAAAAEKMGAMVQVIDDAQKNLHAVTAELRPVVLDDFGLAAAIEWQVEAFTGHSGIGCRFENDGFEPDLPKAQATTVFRIFQEILTNVARHAQADDVTVRLAAHLGDMVLEVRDNGRGITEAQINAPTAYGLMGIRERLHPWNGSVTFEGRPGQGTCVTVHMPLATKGTQP